MILSYFLDLPSKRLKLFPYKNFMYATIAFPASLISYVSSIAYGLSRFLKIYATSE